MKECTDVLSITHQEPPQTLYDDQIRSDILLFIAWISVTGNLGISLLCSSQKMIKSSVCVPSAVLILPQKRDPRVSRDIRDTFQTRMVCIVEF